MHLCAVISHDEIWKQIKESLARSADIWFARNNEDVVSYYLYEKQEQPTGPYSLDELLAMWCAGSISSEAFFCEEGYTEWLPIQTLIKDKLSSDSTSPITHTAQIIPSEKRDRNVAILVVLVVVLAISIITHFSPSQNGSRSEEVKLEKPSPEYTSLRAVGAINQGSRLVKHMRTRYKANDDNAKPVFSAFPNFGGQISVAVASVLSGYGSH